MNNASTESQPVSRLRLWPAWLICAVMLLCIGLSVTPSIANGPRFMLMVGGPVLGGLAFIVWAMFASRLSAREKVLWGLAASILPALSLILTMPGLATRSMLLLYGLPLAVVAVVIALTIGARSPRRVAWSAALMAVAWSFFPVIRNEGFDGDYYPELAWRFAPVHEQTLPELRTPSEIPTISRANPDWAKGQSWPAFRGPQGNGSVDDQLADQDWSSKPPKELWRIDIGPGWSSFAYHEGRLFTQEQRGEMEHTTCYSAEDGSLLWSHGDAVRFEEVVSGAGPRGTPSVAEGRVYAMGARALLTCLDEQRGTVIWQRNLEQEVQAKVPTWAFSGSPLVIGNLVIIFAGGSGDNGLIAVDSQSGQTVWAFSVAGESENYTTARLLRLADVDCLIFCDGRGVHALEPLSGALLWDYKPAQWSSSGMKMVDPQALDSTRLLVSLGDGVGLCCLQVTLDGDQWTISENWTTTQLRPSFNDSLVHGDLIFGFNQNIFGCIDAHTGQRLWHGGRYGFGQAILLKNSRTILVVSEKGDLILLKAQGDKLEVLQRQPVLDGKTWNHPIVVGDRLFMRNGKTAVCLQLASWSSSG
ncbi:MAG: PQQ-binding-like beta-propeller repeat protein [Pirellulaceae bacterium]|nr:PQQ-binding-like beta-propeller repeat protein [Pirellulaceae bacterium]